jgi:hypothetical protein
MFSKSVWKLTLLLGTVTGMPATAGFGPGEAAARSQTAPSARRNADFKVLLWYRHADPLASFKYQVYDLRKSEYTSAVDVWVKDVQVKYPAYTAFIRDVDLAAEKGETDLLKVGAVIKRELSVAAALSGVVLGSPINSRGRRIEPPQNSSPRTDRRAGALSIDRSFLNPSPTPFPVPLPYPRPHP